VPDAVAAVLGITQQPGKSVAESVASALDGRVRLLVFDNCEHVLDTVADMVEAILASSATVTMLATSREGVGHADEQLWPVPSLDIDAAVDLFIERARVAAAFVVVDASMVAEICRRLDGTPLAIELAASRISSMAVDEIRNRLGHRFKLLGDEEQSFGRHADIISVGAWVAHHRGPVRRRSCETA
jgi:predicted ATPase